jgi:uncharacterized protein YdiU (UPF0061 family)
MLAKLGFNIDFEAGYDVLARELLKKTIEFLHNSQVGYHQFFAQLAIEFRPEWRSDLGLILDNVEIVDVEIRVLFEQWRDLYFKMLNSLPESDMELVAKCLNSSNPQTVIVRPLIESVWEKIDQENDWSAFNELLQMIRA